MRFPVDTETDCFICSVCLTLDKTDISPKREYEVPDQRFIYGPELLGWCTPKDLRNACYRSSVAKGRLMTEE